MAEHIDRNISRTHSLQDRSEKLVTQSRTLRPFDDVIVSLANAKENRRARQVNEWESLRKRHLNSPI